MVIRVLLIGLLGILWIVHLLKQFGVRRQRPPGPSVLTVLGAILLNGFQFREDTFIKLGRPYGNIYSLWLGTYFVVVLSGFQAVKEGLIDHAEELSERPLTPLLKVIGKEKGIVFSNGHTWKQQRRFGVVTMRKLGLGRKGMERQIEEEARQLVNDFASTEGQPFDPSSFLTSSVSNVICAVTFGYRFSPEDKFFKELMKSVEVGLRLGFTIFHFVYEIIPQIMDHLPGPHNKVFAAIDMLFSLAQKEIKRHKEQHSFHEPQDFTDFYLLQMERSSKDPSSTYDEENLAQCITDFFVAGTETTMTSLKWALLLLTKHPDIQDKVHKEIEETFGSHAISYQDKRKLPYTNAVIHEIQRSRYTFLYGLPRQCTKDMTIQGFFIPKSTMIIPDLRSVLQDPEHWETPHEFSPNHFLDKDGNFVAREEFLAFGAGTRACLGEQLAQMEIFLFLTSLLQVFRFQRPEGVKELSQDSIAGLTAQPQPYKICAVPRCTSS
ncbi:Cytochrome P450 2J2 [Varanus komodoensis]|uniref:cytochrome P450 2J2-like n=1 Tax=Varanus komodoensis TaxID=61221 RepID=UPI001CF7951F|nr:cytochrome P450 2J2-like [Varanus komodoensis]KAF7235667.1 Cytochrome P450 2J2 [Varanus komodoensis]